ncbi:hypothetical protein [Xanthocytophaga agilis]|uniref:Fibronectin type-III domain-containing protein n=1 Tax=Xanthocytophaga agilis TaxID=3048010 RepID=A0AAE3RD41_9BACT|nr:hypothetical protein [Xanthocytophaga agilis]MDJ1506334.1 hypothetical protein [Xanthocytophaga agilis]
MKPIGDYRQVLPTLHSLLACIFICIGMSFSACRYQPGQIPLPEYGVLFVPMPPTVQLDSVNARSLPVQLHGTITAQGSDTVTRYGFAFSAFRAVPTVSDSLVAVTGKPAFFPFAFHLSSALFKRATRYYVRAFAENAQGVSYNKDVLQLLVPDNRILPEVALNDIESIAATSANAKAILTSDGNTPITAYGVCYSTTSTNPTLADKVLVTGSAVTGSAVTGSAVTGALPFGYAQALSSLTDNTTYYVRAFASNALGTAYSSTVSFKTTAVPTAAPTVQTDNTVNITTTTATIDGTLVSRGTAPIIQYGVCYSPSNATPTLANTVVVAGTTDPATFPLSFSATLTGLTQRTMYFVRTFATSSVGTSYGVVRSFTTSTPVATPPSVQTNEVVATSITTSSATASGTLLTDGTASIVQYGFCYSTTNPNPTTADALITSGNASPTSFPFNYTGNLTGLAAGTVYTLRAFARSSAGTSYGATKTFRTIAAATAPPTVQTVTIHSISYNSASVLGNLTSSGTAPVTEYGIVYSATNANPTTADNKQVTASAQPGSFPFGFTGNLSRLVPNTTYAVRAYATSSVGTSYGAVQRFTTLVATPNVTTDRVVYSEARNSVTASGSVQSAGVSAITRYGFCYSATSATPTIADNPTDVGTTVGNVPMAFSYSFIRWAPGTYYVRAYAANSNGVAYGSVIVVGVYVNPTITTDRTATKDNAAGIQTLFGSISSGGSAVIDEYGFCYVPSANATTNFQVGDQTVSVVRKTRPVPASFPFGFSLEVTVPQNTDYSFRAYAKTANGYVYGSIHTFYITYKP